ncbi:hypothetical protein GCM10027047_26340 [Rhodococcus aerolatus]
MSPAAAQADVDLDVGGGSTVLLPVVWLFAAVLVTFVVTRTVTRVIRARGERVGDAPPAAEEGRGLIGDITIGGVHVHHQVFGIVTMAATGIVTIASTPVGAGLDVAAVLFGIGMGLTFDEFALWVHLDDVYWTESGRASVDAVFVLLVTTLLLATGSTLVVGRFGSGEWWASVAALAVSLGFSAVCLLKGKVVTAVVGLVSIAGLVGACRLAKPDSWWARRRYAARPRRMARARRRFGPAYEARWNRARDLVAGAPTRPVAR